MNSITTVTKEVGQLKNEMERIEVIKYGDKGYKIESLTVGSKPEQIEGIRIARMTMAWVSIVPIKISTVDG